MLTIITIFFCLIAIAFVASPFLQQKQEWGAEIADSKREKMNMQKEQYYQAIRDVDFEFAEGKLNESDHDELREFYKEKAVLTIKSIEAIEQNGDGEKKNPPAKSESKRS